MQIKLWERDRIETLKSYQQWDGATQSRLRSTAGGATPENSNMLLYFYYLYLHLFAGWVSQLLVRTFTWSNHSEILMSTNVLDQLLPLLGSDFRFGSLI